MIVSKAKELRKARGYEVSNIAATMDCCEHIVYEVENHIDHAKMYRLEAYAKAIGCKVKDLFEECE